MDVIVYCLGRGNANSCSYSWRFYYGNSVFAIACHTLLEKSSWKVGEDGKVCISFDTLTVQCCWFFFIRHKFSFDYFASAYTAECRLCSTVYVLNHAQLIAWICINMLLFPEIRRLMHWSTVCLRITMSGYQSLTYATTSMKVDCFLQSRREIKACIQKHWNCWITSTQQKPPLRQPWYVSSSSSKNLGLGTIEI